LEVQCRYSCLKKALSPGSLDENQVEKACEDLRVKNAELKKAINHMIKENTLYKKKYNVGRCYNEVLHFVKFNFRK
jgi:hypothetical protein